MKKYWILAIVVVVILGVIFIPKLIFNEGGNTIKFKALEENEIPQKIQDILPKYKALERALACKVDDEIYVVVTRGEKNTEGYSVTIDKIEKIETENNKFEVVVYAKYKDPNPDEIVAQVITYPVTVVKTDLKEMPEKIKLEVEYMD